MILTRLAKGKLSSPFTLRDIYKNHWTGIDTPKKAQETVDVLIDYAHLTREEIFTNGRPTAVFYWVGAGHE